MFFLFDSPPVSGFLLRGLGEFETVAGEVEIYDHAVVHQAVDGGCGGHCAFDKFAPTSRMAGCWSAPLVTLRQQCEEHLNLLPRLFHVAQIVDDQSLETRQPFQFSGEPQVSFGNERLLHQQVVNSIAQTCSAHSWTRSSNVLRYESGNRLGDFFCNQTNKVTACNRGCCPNCSCTSDQISSNGSIRVRHSRCGWTCEGRLSAQRYFHVVFSSIPVFLDE